MRRNGIGGGRNTTLNGFQAPPLNMIQSPEDQTESADDR